MQIQFVRNHTRFQRCLGTVRASHPPYDPPGRSAKLVQAALAELVPLVA